MLTKVVWELSGVGRSCQEVPEGVRRHQGLSGVGRSCHEVPDSVRGQKGLSGVARGCLGVIRSWQELAGGVKKCQKVLGDTRGCQELQGWDVLGVVRSLQQPLAMSNSWKLLSTPDNPFQLM